MHTRRKLPIKPMTDTFQSKTWSISPADKKRSDEIERQRETERRKQALRRAQLDLILPLPPAGQKPTVRYQQPPAPLVFTVPKTYFPNPSDQANQIYFPINGDSEVYFPSTGSEIYFPISGHHQTYHNLTHNPGGQLC